MHTKGEEPTNLTNEVLGGTGESFVYAVAGDCVAVGVCA